jgi:hypothetical protein
VLRHLLPLLLQLKKRKKRKRRKRKRRKRKRKRLLPHQLPKHLLHHLHECFLRLFFSH